MVRTLSNRYRWTRLFNARRKHILVILNTQKVSFGEVFYNFQNIPENLRRGTKQHPSKSAHLIRRFVQGLSIYVHQSLIPTDLHAQFSTCGTRGAASTYPSIPNTTDRQRYASQTAKLDLAPHQSQTLSPIHSVHCLSKPALCEFLLACFQIHHQRMRRKLPCSIHKPANQTSRIKCGIHASRAPPPIISPHKTVIWNIE
jgi:hypothetical protein